MKHLVGSWKRKFEKLALPSPAGHTLYTTFLVNLRNLRNTYAFTHASIGEGDPSRTDAKQGDEKR